MRCGGKHIHACSCYLNRDDSDSQYSTDIVNSFIESHAGWKDFSFMVSDDLDGKTGCAVQDEDKDKYKIYAICAEEP